MKKIMLKQHSIFCQRTQRSSPSVGLGYRVLVFHIIAGDFALPLIEAIIHVFGPRIGVNHGLGEDELCGHEK
jgi:hypothetical protein